MVSLSLENATLPEAYSVPYPIHQFSVEQYESMARCGILTEDDPVELLEGWIVPKKTKNPLHEGVVSQLHKSLIKRLPEGFFVRVQSAIQTIDSSPEPDLAVIRGEPTDYYIRHPQPEDIPLLIEVSESSLTRDRNKRRMYARARIASYWIVNLVEMCVEVYGDPTGFEQAHYQTSLKFTRQETLEFTQADGIRITLPVSEFLKSIS